MKWSLLISLTVLLVVFLFNPTEAGADGKIGIARERLTAVDIRGRKHYSTPGRQVPWLGDAVRKQKLPFPEWAYFYGHEGSGVFRLVLDPRTGGVLRVNAIKSTGFRELDDSAIAYLAHWQWKPGTWVQLDLPVTFHWEDLTKTNIPYRGRLQPIPDLTFGHHNMH